MDLKREDDGDSDAGEDSGTRFGYSECGGDGSATALPRDAETGDVLVPPEVLEGIEDAIEGRTMDGDDLDDALLF